MAYSCSKIIIITFLVKKIIDSDVFTTKFVIFVTSIHFPDLNFST